MADRPPGDRPLPAGPLAAAESQAAGRPGAVWRLLAGRLDPGWLVVLLISLIALWPLLSRASLPQETDAELHVFRLAELSSLVRAGELYPRWAPDFYHGYGYPIFNYYAPLTYYLGLAVELLPRLDAVDGIKGVLLLSWLLAAAGCYGFGRDNWGRPAGFVAAAAYLYAPYVQYVDPLARGAVAEALSLGVFPLALWQLDRLRRAATGSRLAAAVLAVAAVVLAHNLMALLFFGILAAWAVWQAWRSPPERGPGEAPFAGARPVLLALLLGLGLSAFFWLPVALERQAVNLVTLIGENNNYDFHTHFLTWAELLAPSRRLDWGASQPAFRFNLGVAQWLWGGLGLLWLARPGCRRSQRLFWGGVLLILLFMMVPWSTRMWETIPLLPFFQFPWRLLGGAAFALAVLAGTAAAPLAARLGPRLGPSAPAIMVGSMLLLGLPLSQPSPWPDFDPVHRARVAEIEFKGRWIGTTSTADYVPATVDVVPPPNESMMNDFFAGRPLDRVNRLTLPAGASVEAEEVTPLWTRYYVTTPKDFRLRLFQFDFPGWRALVDGQPVATELAEPEGFIVVPVPAGTHVVTVRFGSTPARTAAWAISGLALLATAAAGWRLSQAQSRDDGRCLPWQAADNRVLAVAATVTGLFLVWLQPAGWLRYESTGDDVAVAQVSRLANLGEQISLLGYDAATRRAQPGQQITVTLYWKARQPLSINYQSFVHVLSPAGGLVSQSDRLNPGDFPTRRWSPDRYVRDVHVLQLPPDLAPGAYSVSTGLWVQAEGWRLPVLDQAGRQVGDTVTLFELEVAAP